jgi:trigger factor
LKDLSNGTVEQWNHGNIMNVDKKQLENSQIELNVELSYEEFKPYISQGTTQVSQETEIEGFRPGKAPYDVLKQKVGEMTILEKAARLAVNNTVQKALDENLERQPIGQPRVDITKLAPNESMQYKVVVALLPEVNLGEYKSLDIKPEEFEVEDNEIEDTLKNLQERQVTEKSVDRGAKDGDRVVVDIDMYQQDVALEGGQSRDTAIIIGQQNLVPGFDDNIKGAKKNEEKKFSLTYPEKHHQKNLAGKKVDFKVVIKDVQERELPKLDDDFASKIGVSTLDELKKLIKENLQKEKQQHAQQKTEIKLIDKIIESSKFGDMPDVLVSNEAETMLSEMEQNIKNQGGKFDDYLKSIGKTREQLMMDMTPDAVKRVKSALVIREIAQEENIDVTKEEVDKKQQELLEQYKGYQKVEERVKEPSYRNYLQNVIANRKVIDKLKEWNLSQEPQEEKTREKGDTEEVKKSDARKEEKKGKTPRDDKKEEEY